MRTNIDIDDTLLAEARTALGTRGKRETVEAALREVVERQKQIAAFEALRGSGWDGDLDAMRRD